VPAALVPQTGGVGGSCAVVPSWCIRAPACAAHPGNTVRAATRRIPLVGCTPGRVVPHWGVHVGTPPPGGNGRSRNRRAPGPVENSTASGPLGPSGSAARRHPRNGCSASPTDAQREHAAGTRGTGERQPPAGAHSPRRDTGQARHPFGAQCGVRGRNAPSDARSETLAGFRGTLGSAGPVLPPFPVGRVTVQGSHSGGPANG
jgi:hypothetical protein